LEAESEQEIMSHNTEVEPVEEIADELSANEAVQAITVYGSGAQSTTAKDEENNMVCRQRQHHMHI